MRTRARWTCLLVLVVAVPATASDLSVRVADAVGPVADAVVDVFPADGAAPVPSTRIPATAAIDQRDLAFVPYVQLARPGGTAVFRNSDHTRHHVYSFSPAATFEMVLGPGERSGPVSLERPGVIAVGCNIHDQMIAWVVVSDAPWLARTGDDGRADFRDLPAGEYRVRVWHPRLDVRDPAIERRVTLAPGAVPATVPVALRLRPDAGSGHDPERADY